MWVYRTEEVVMTEENKTTDLIEVMAGTAMMQRGAFWNVLRSTVIPAKFSDEQVMVFLSVAQQMGLNPLNNEIYAFEGRGGKIVPMIGIDGALRRINDHKQFDGMQLTDGTDKDRGNYTEITIHRKDRSHPTVLREYLNECRKDTGPWGSHPSRMLRHRTIIQGARVAFGTAGAADEDDKTVFAHVEYEDVTEKAKGTINKLTEALAESRGADQVYDEDFAGKSEDAEFGTNLPDDFTPCSVAGCGKESGQLCKDCSTPLCKDHHAKGLCAICATEK